MDNFEIFKKFLDENKFDYKQEVLETGERFFRVSEKLKNDQVVNAVIIFSAQSIKIILFGIAQIEGEEKQIACLKLFNRFARQYSFFKFYLRENGDVHVETDVIAGVFAGEFRPRILMAYVNAGADLVQEVYEDIIKIQNS